MFRFVKNIFYNLISSNILMFHHIDDGNIIQKSGCVLSKKKFLSIIDSNLTFVPIMDVVKHRYKNINNCTITFDDGLQDVYTVAYPELKKRSIPFTVFIVTGFLDTEGYISTAQLVELANDSLVTIGSHGVTHKILNEMTIEEQKFELYESKKILESIIKKPINIFAYSHGQFNKNTLKILGGRKQYNYAFGVKGYPLNVITKCWKYDLPRINCENNSFTYYIVNKKTKSILKKDTKK